MLKKALLLIKDIFRWIRGQRKYDFTVQRLEDVPTSPRADIVYLVGEKDFEWVAILLCPCGCGELIQLNLLECSSRPQWDVVFSNDGAATITPSIWKNKGCHSHFIIRDGNIHWCC